MRHLDEILSIYPAQEPRSKRYLLRRLERLALTADSAAADQLFRQAEGSEVADFAVLAEDQFYPRHEKQRMQRASGTRSEESGDWSRFFDQHAGPRGPDSAEALEKAAAPRLGSMVEGLREALGRGGPSARAALKVLSRIRVPGSLEAIRSTIRDEALVRDAMAALSTFGGPEAEAVGLELARAWEGTPFHEGLVYSMRGFVGGEVLRYLYGLLNEPRLHAPVATALEAMQDHDCLAALGHILASPDPWTQLQAIETLGRLGGDEHIQKIGEVFENPIHPLVQVACLQAVASTGSPKGGFIGMKGLEVQDPMVQAAAIEALVALPVPKVNYSERVLRLLDTTHPRLAMNAALACVVLDSQRAAARIHKLIKDGSASHLMQGIHCLAYMDHPSTAPLLAALGQRCPTGELRLQAIRALGRHAEGTPAAAAPLASFLGQSDPRERQTAAWFLSHCEGMVRPGAVTSLTQALQTESHAETERVLVLALGLSGPGCQEAAGLLGRKLEGASELRNAAAWSLVAACGDSGEVAALSKSPHRDLKAWGCLHAWFSRGEGLDQLGGLIRSTQDEEVLGACLAVARLAAEVTTFASGPDNLAGLCRALSEEDSAGGAGAGDLGRLLSSGTHRLLGGPGTGAEVRPQLIREKTPGMALPTGEEAVRALADHQPTETDAAKAMAVASYYAIPRDTLEKALAAGGSERQNPFYSESFAPEDWAEESGELTTPSAPEEGSEPGKGDSPEDEPPEDEADEPQDGLARLVLFVLTAFVVGQAARYLLLLG